MKKIFMTILLITFAVSTYAGERYGGFLSEKLNTRAVGLGEAYITISDGGGFLYNPAGLAYAEKLYLGYTMYSSYNDFNNYEVILPLVSGGGLALAASYTTLAVTGVEGRDHQGNLTGEIIDSREGSIAAGMGLKFEENLGIGISIKQIRHELGEREGEGVTVDFGLLSNIGDFLYLGAVMTNARGGILTWDEERNIYDDIPTTLRFGSSLRLFEDGFITAVEYENELGEIDRTVTKIGQEIWIKDTLALRVGRKAEKVVTIIDDIAYEESQVVMNYGAGLRIRGLRFDYAFSREDLGDVNRYTFGINF